MRIASVLLMSLLLGASGCGNTTKEQAVTGAPPKALRLGYFANLTHAQALIGVARGDFQQALGETNLETKLFNAGPSVVEAFFAGELDLAYVGPSPAVNAYVKSRGRAVRIVSGSAANGVVIVARKDSGIGKLEDLAGRRLATPQYGNTQDVAARRYLLRTLGVKLKEAGGDTEILTVSNAEQLGLFKAGQLDAAWVPEPWGARLIHETGATLLEEEKNLWPAKRFSSVVLVVSKDFLERYPKTVAAFVQTHEKLTEWIGTHRDEAAGLANAELLKASGKALQGRVLQEAFSRIEFTTDPLAESIETSASWSAELGFLKEVPDLKGLFVKRDAP